MFTCACNRKDHCDEIADTLWKDPNNGALYMLCAQCEATCTPMIDEQDSEG